MKMTLYAVAAIYFVIWWLCLFVVLPFGVRPQSDQTGGTVAGTVPSAPARPMLIRKALVTTVLAAILTGAIWYAHDHLGWTIDGLSRMLGPQPV